jgi:hypothetical protein
MIQSQSTTQAVRAVFIIDPKAIIRVILYYPAAVGRNFDEIKRTLLALQKADKDGVATPQTGVLVIIPLFQPQVLVVLRKNGWKPNQKTRFAWIGSYVSRRKRKTNVLIRKAMIHSLVNHRFFKVMKK